MTVRQLRKLLAMYPNDAHAVMAIVPDSVIVIQKEGAKLELHDVWCDGHGCLNLIAVTPANKIDPSLRRENDLEEI